MDYLIEDLLPTNQVHLIGGPSGSGKTTLSFQLYKNLLRGEDFLGRKTKRVKWGYISGDRPARSVQETQERVGVFFPVYSTVDNKMIGHDLKDEIIPQMTSFINGRPDFIYIDGFTAMVPGGKINEYLVVAEWLGDLQRYCCSKEITILGACHTTKTKEGEKFLNPRQRIAGSVAWAAYSESVIIIEPDDELGDKNKRWVHLLPRNKKPEHLVMFFDDEGILQLPESVKHQEDIAELVMGPLIGTTPGTSLDYPELMRKTSKAGVSRRSADRYLATLVETGRLVHGKRGEYSIPGKEENNDKDEIEGSGD